MCNSTTVAELPESSIWRGRLSEEEVQTRRKKHRDLVKAWLDFADFATELFNLHEKYGIEIGEPGYVAYRKRLRKLETQFRADYGLTVDPLDEGCQCIFCRTHSEEKPTREPAQAAIEPKPTANATPEKNRPHSTRRTKPAVPDPNCRKSIVAIERDWRRTVYSTDQSAFEKICNSVNQLPLAKKRRANCADRTVDGFAQDVAHYEPCELIDHGKKITRRNPYRKSLLIRVRGSPQTCQKKTSVG